MKVSGPLPPKYPDEVQMLMLQPVVELVSEPGSSEQVSEGTGPAVNVAEGTPYPALVEETELVPSATELPLLVKAGGV